MKDNFKRHLWINIGIIFGSMLIAMAALYFLSNDLSSKADKITSDWVVVGTQTVALSNLASLKHYAPIAAGYEVAMDKLLPDQYTLLSFGPWLNDLGAKYGVTTHFSLGSSITPSTATTAGSANFSAQAAGSSASLTSFMKELELEAPGFLLQISSFDFTDNGSSSQVTVQGELFFQ